MSAPLKVAVIGAGAIGRLYGGWLALGGAEVSLLGRSHALQGDLTIRGPVDARSVRLAPTTLAEADAVLIATKLYDLDEAAALAATHARPDAPVLGLQNGVSAQDILRAHFAPDRLLVGPVYSPATVSGALEVTHPGGRDSVVIGNPFGHAHPVAARLVEAWRAAGVDASVSDDIARVLWRKYLALVTNAALTTLTRLPAGLLYRDASLRDLARRSIRETLAIGRAEGVALTEADAEQALAYLTELPVDTVASMHQDLLAGRRLELDAFSGHVTRRARAHGLATPFHDIAYALLRPFADGPPHLPPAPRSTI